LKCGIGGVVVGILCCCKWSSGESRVWNDRVLKGMIYLELAFVRGEERKGLVCGQPNCFVLFCLLCRMGRSWEDQGIQWTITICL
jgi:hypothetical protein